MLFFRYFLIFSSFFLSFFLFAQNFDQKQCNTQTAPSWNALQKLSSKLSTDFRYQCQLNHKNSVLSAIKLSGGPYPRPLYVFLPENFTASNFCNPILHFHGHLFGSFEEDVLCRYSFKNKATSLSPSSIVIIPESQGKCDDYRLYFQSEKNLEALQNYIFSELIKRNICKQGKVSWKISGHSGAYFPVAKILENYVNSPNCTLPAALKNITGIYLFDALYDFGPVFEGFLGKLSRCPTSMNFVHVARKQGGPYNSNLNLARKFPVSEKIKIINTDQKDHWKVVDDFWNLLK